MSLDCFDVDRRAASAAATVAYEEDGYSRWPFFEYLSEKYGVAFVTDIYTELVGGAPSATAALANALAAKGTTLADAYNAWATAQLTGGYTASACSRASSRSRIRRPSDRRTKAGTMPDGSRSRSIISRRATSSSTAATATTTGACYAATLSLTVAIPAGTLSKPIFYWNGAWELARSPLSINGSTASAAIPWDTCTWSGPVGLLSLPNASTTVDGADFFVTASMTIDTTKPTAALLPPAPVGVNTPVVSAPSTDVAPLISVFGPELLKLSATDRQIRLIVQSNGSGTAPGEPRSRLPRQLDAAAREQRRALHRCPRASLSALRRSAATSNVLTLTPVSASGASGTAVTRKVSIAPAATKSVKPKAKAKPKAKPKKHK